MDTIETSVRKTPFGCPPWCTVNHSHPLCRLEEKHDGERVHGTCVGDVGDASVWVNRVDVIAINAPGPVTVWAETEGGDLNTEQSIEYAMAVMRALAIAAQPTALDSSAPSPTEPREVAA